MWIGILLLGLPVVVPRLAGGFELPSIAAGLSVFAGILLMFLALNLLTRVRKLERDAG